MCAYAATACARAELIGQIVELRSELQGATLRLRQADGAEAELSLRPPWERLVGDLERHGLAFVGDERAVSLAAYHLQVDPTTPGRWLAGREALVVLEPEWLEDVTSLTKTQYCERHYLIGKFSQDAANEAILKGVVAHATFRQIVASPHDNELLQRALDQALRGSLVTLAALGLDPEEARAAALPALRQLVRWARSRGPDGEARSETFLLAHRLGMRGRIDAAWERDGRIETVAELKTGMTWNGRARAEHELQVGAYGLMLAERGKADLRQERLLLLYAGNPDRNGQPDLERQVPFRIQTFANLVHFRNRLVLIDLTGRATYQAPNRCRPCRVKRHCHRLTELLEAPRCAGGCVLEKDCDGTLAFEHEERDFFRDWAGLLDREWRAINDATARLWRTAPATRCADGSAAEVLATEAGETTPDGGYLYRLRLGNDCEIRQNDRVILSEASGPVAGRVAQVEVLEASGRELLVVLGEPLGFEPRWVDQLGSDRLFLRAYAGLYGWLDEPAERRELVTRLRAPRFEPVAASVRTELPGGRALNDRQRQALELAQRAEDYALIQGPPGTGKTEVIAALARQLTAAGQRVLLLAGTNRALDRLLAACARLGLEDRLVRLGSRPEPGSVGERRLLERLAWRGEGKGPHPFDTPAQRFGVRAGSAAAAAVPLPCAGEGAASTLPNGVVSAPLPCAGEEALSPALPLAAAPGSPTLPLSHSPTLAEAVQSARQLLQGAPIVAATIATLSGGAYAGLRGQFDMVVVDEASQVTLPAALGVVGFGRRFVLVGDHRQLPPVVQSESSGGPGLSESLFEYLVRAREANGQPGVVRLEEQYRMSAEICDFPSRAWYGGALRPAPSVAAARLAAPVGAQFIAPSARTRTSQDIGPAPGEGAMNCAPTDLARQVLDPDRPVIFIDVPGSELNAPRLNRREAGLARLILEEARRVGLSSREMAVIAPFRAQVALIRSELAGSEDEELRTLAHELADTVDRFQGSERDVVIYSFSSFGPEVHPLMLDERRLNVALTRARHKLVLLGDLRVLRSVPRFAELETYCRGLYPGGVVEWTAACHPPIL